MLAVKNLKKISIRFCCPGTLNVVNDKFQVQLMGRIAVRLPSPSRGVALSIRGHTGGQGMVFGLSVLNRVLNLIRVCPKQCIVSMIVLVDSDDNPYDLPNYVRGSF